MANKTKKSDTENEADGKHSAEIYRLASTTPLRAEGGVWVMWKPLGP